MNTRSRSRTTRWKSSPGSRGRAGAPARSACSAFPGAASTRCRSPRAKPPALKAIITICSTDDRYEDDVHYKGGTVINEMHGWAATMLAYSSRPPDPKIVGNKWRKMWMNRLEHEPFLLIDWLKHPHRDAYWKHGSVCEDFAAIEAPTLVVGGWNDAYSNAVPRLMKGLRTDAQSHHRAMGAQVSAFRRAGTAHRLPAGSAALVGPVAERRRHRRQPRSGLSLLCDGVLQARHLPGAHQRPLAGRQFLGLRPYRHQEMGAERVRHRTHAAGGEGAHHLFEADDGSRRRRILHHLAWPRIPGRPGEGRRRFDSPSIRPHW
jgi:hypothetical protein